MGVGGSGGERVEKGRRQIFKIKESEREKLNLILKGVISSPKETNSHWTQCLQKRNLIQF